MIGLVTVVLSCLMLGGVVGALGMALLASSSRPTKRITFLFDGSFQSGPRFVDTVDVHGYGVGVGEWDTERLDGLFGLVVDLPAYEVRSGE